MHGNRSGDVVRKAAGWVVLLFIMAALGRDVTTSGKPLTVLLIFALALTFALVRPKVAVIAAVLSAFTLDGLTFLVPAIPGRVVWVQEVVLIALATATLVHVGRRGFRATPVLAPVLALLVVGVLSTVLNVGSPIVALLGFRNYFKHVLLFLALVNLELDEPFRRKLVGLLMWLAALQVPIALAQRLTTQGRSGDMVGGTLGPYASGVLTILLLGLAGVALGWYLTRSAVRLKYALLALFLLIPTAINETKVVFFAAPIMFAVVLRRGFAVRTGRVLVAVALASTFLWGAYQVYDIYYGQTVGPSAFSREYLASYLLTERVEGGVMNRLPALGFAIREIAQDPITLVAGHGPGAASDSTFEFGRGPVYVKYGDLKVDSTFAERFILEYGIIGIAFFMWLIVTLFRSAGRAYRESDDPYWRGVVIGLEGLTVLMITLSVYTSTFTIDALSVTFWVLAGLVGSNLTGGSSERVSEGTQAGDPVALATPKALARA